MSQDYHDPSFTDSFPDFDNFEPLTHVDLPDEELDWGDESEPVILPPPESPSNQEEDLSQPKNSEPQSETKSSETVSVGQRKKKMILILLAKKRFVAFPQSKLNPLVRNSPTVIEVVILIHQVGSRRIKPKNDPNRRQDRRDAKVLNLVTVQELTLTSVQAHEDIDLHLHVTDPLPLVVTDSHPLHTIIEDLRLVMIAIDQEVLHEITGFTDTNEKDHLRAGFTDTNEKDHLSTGFTDTNEKDHLRI